MQQLDRDQTTGALSQVSVQRDASKTALQGSYLLIDSFEETSSGEIDRSRGAKPKGSLYYDDHGRMSVHVMNDGRPGPDELGADYLSNAAAGYTAYFGVYEIDELEGSVTHHMEGSLLPHEVGASRKRFYTIDGQTLTLVAFVTVNGERRKRYIVWRRLC